MQQQNIPIKITKEEIDSFTKLKNDIQRNIFEFCELYLEKMEVDRYYKELQDKELSLRNKTEEFKKSEVDLMTSIYNKYGDGNLDIVNGIFTPSPKKE